jgi:hypothetical protein
MAATRKSLSRRRQAKRTRSRAAAAATRRRAATARRRNRNRSRAARKDRRTRSRNYRGGMMDYQEAVSGNRLIDPSMVPSSATAPLDAAMSEASAMAAMSGGKRRHRQRGGEQDYNAPGMLLPAAMYNDAGLNPEWRSVH